MECRDAQFYLRFRRPGSDDLGPEVAADLDHHLAGCEHCAAEAGPASAFDSAVATAMREVAVPTGLRNKLVAHVAEKRGAELRRKAYRYAGTAAAVFLALGLSFGLFAGRPTFDVDKLGARLDGQLENPSEAVQNWLKDQKVTALPEPFDPRFFELTSYDRVEGRSVPFIAFRDQNGQWARVYVLRRDGPFKLNDLQGFQKSNCMGRVYDDEQKFRDVVFVVVHNGPDLRPLLKINGGRANI
jgi:hypothetical protein